MVAGCTEVSVQQLFPTIFATNDGRTPTLGPKIMHRSILPIFYCQIRSEKGGGSVTKRIQSERSQEAVIFRAHPPAPHPLPSIFLWKIDYLPVLGLRAGLLRMFDAFTLL